jgi:cbb3-type cytochrome oxidase subunit 1
MFWMTTLPLQDSLEAAMPFWITRAISGVLLMIGTTIYIVNLFFLKNRKHGLEVAGE